MSQYDPLDEAGRADAAFVDHYVRGAFGVEPPESPAPAAREPGHRSPARTSSSTGYMKADFPGRLPE